MAITTKEIAEIVGVSRGTVDRVLNDRGRVSEQMKRRVLEVAEAHGFEPSHVGRALARAKNPVKIGVVVHLARLPFFRQVMEGVGAAAEELANLGGQVLVEEIDSLDPAAHVAAVDRLAAQGVQGLAISPLEDEALIRRLNELAAGGVAVVTFNTDIPGIHRRAFVGLDNTRSGQTAAGLMHLLLGKTGGQVLIVSGFITNKTNSQRVDGFVQLLAERHGGITVPGIQFNADDDGKAYDIVREALRATPDLAGIYMVSSGQAGACRALEEAGRGEDVRLIVFDILPDTRRYIESGTIDFIIDQNAHAQGSLPPRLLFDILFDGKEPPEGDVYTDIVIKTRYNL